MPTPSPPSREAVKGTGGGAQGSQEAKAQPSVLTRAGPWEASGQDSSPLRIGTWGPGPGTAALPACTRSTISSYTISQQARKWRAVLVETHCYTTHGSQLEEIHFDSDF